MSYAALSLGLFIFIFAFFTLGAPKTTMETKTTETVSNFCELVNPDDAPTFQAPADNATKTGSEDDELLGTPIVSADCSGRGVRHQFSTNPTTYRLIRKSVPLSTTDVKKKGENFTDKSCHFDSIEKLDIDIPELDKTKFKVFYPQISGEISLDREIPSRTRGRNSNLLYFIDYGLIFLLHLNPDGSFTEYKGGTTRGDSETFYLADVYKDVGSGRPDLPDDAFTCDEDRGSQNASAGQVVIPDQAVSSSSAQLQLQYFVFGNASGGEIVNGWGIHCKPAVYLYPPKKQIVNVKVFPSGFLTFVDPPYDKEKGWTVEAFPDGKLFSINNGPITNNYLYFESKIKDQVIKKPEKGWVVKYDQLNSLYQNILPQLGLNETQTKDFIEYWQKALPYSTYYFVGVIDGENVNQIERLEITPKPDSINRVRIYFERLDEFKEVEPPVLNSINDSRLTINDFRVVEWGGMVKNDPNHPFTCSQ